MPVFAPQAHAPPGSSWNESSGKWDDSTPSMAVDQFLGLAGDQWNAYINPWDTKVDDYLNRVAGGQMQGFEEGLKKLGIRDQSSIQQILRDREALRGGNARAFWDPSKSNVSMRYSSLKGGGTEPGLSWDAPLSEGSQRVFGEGWGKTPGAGLTWDPNAHTFVNSWGGSVKSARNPTGGGQGNVNPGGGNLGGGPLNPAGQQQRMASQVQGMNPMMAYRKALDRQIAANKPTGLAGAMGPMGRGGSVFGAFAKGRR